MLVAQNLDLSQRTCCRIMFQQLRDDDNNDDGDTGDT